MPSAITERTLVVEHHRFGSAENFERRTFLVRYAFDRSIKVRRGTAFERRDRLQMVGQALERPLYGYDDNDHPAGACKVCQQRFDGGDLGEDLPL